MLLESVQCQLHSNDLQVAAHYTRNACNINAPGASIA